LNFFIQQAILEKSVLGAENKRVDKPSDYNFTILSNKKERSWRNRYFYIPDQFLSCYGESLTCDNQLILTMEWLVEGLTFCFIGVLVLLITAFTGSRQTIHLIVYLSSTAFLLILSILSLFTGARTKEIPFKICPVIKTVTAILFIIGSL
jgi:hypothetical protein